MKLTPPRLDPKIPRLAARPIVGNLLDYRRNRLGGLERVQRELGDIGAMQFGRIPVVVLSEPELIKAMLVDNGPVFVKGPNYGPLSVLLGNGLITNNGDAHRRNRQIVAPALSHGRFAGYGEAMVGFTRERAAAWKDGGVVDAAEQMTKLTLDIVAKTLFDLDVGTSADTLREAFTEGNRWVNVEVTRLLHLPLSWPLRRHGRMRRTMKRLDEVIYRLILERRLSGKDKGDVLSMLLHAKGADSGEGLTDAQLRDELVTMLFASHETTANALGWTLHLLGKHADVRARAEHEVDAVLRGKLPTIDDLPRLPYTLQVFKEAMRILPPVPVFSRHAAEDVRVGPYQFEKGQFVLVAVWSLHRRPDLYANPEVFEPSRFAPERERLLPRCAYMPFAVGSRICLGKHFAMTEGHLVLATLMQQFRLDPVPEHPVELEPLVTLRARHGLKMRVARRARTSALHPAKPSMNPRDIKSDRRLPISRYQRRYWSKWAERPQSSAFNTSMVFEISGGDLDRAALKQACHDAVQKHEILHATFSEDGSEQRYSDFEMDEYYTEIESGRPVASGAIEAELLAILNRPFDLSRGPLIKFYLLDCGGGRYYFAANAHHILADAVSAKILIADIMTGYASSRGAAGEPSPPSPPAYSYAECIEALHASHTPDKEAAARTFWTSLLAGAPLTVAFPETDAPALDDYSSESIYFELSPAATAELKRFARERDTTLFIVLSALYGYLLAKYAQQETVVVSYPVNMRPAGYGHVFGCFVNLLLTKIVVTRDTTFRMLVDQLTRQRHEVKPHQFFQLAKIVRQLGDRRGDIEKSYFSVFFGETHLNNKPLSLGDLRVEAPNIPWSQEFDRDLRLLFDPSHVEQIKFRMDFRKKKFDRTMIGRFIDEFAQLPTCLIGSEQPLCHITGDRAGNGRGATLGPANG